MSEQIALRTEALLAVLVLVVLFWFMVYVDQQTKAADFSPLPQPECNAVYQRSTKKVLSCD